MSRIQQQTTGQQHSNQVETAELTQTAPSPKSSKPPISSQPSHQLWQGQWWRKHLTKENISTLFGALAVTALAMVNPNLVHILERQAQALFFEIRGPVTPPDNIVIVAIDDASLGQAGIYEQDPIEFAELEPIQTWPWKREAYAKVIDRLLDAGASAVGVDVVLSVPSSYGEADDQALIELLEEHPGKVVLAEQFVVTADLLQGNLQQRELPLPEFQSAGAATGFINLFLEPDARIHRLGQTFLDDLWQQDTMFELLLDNGEVPQSFAQGILRAVGESPAPVRGENIFFYGPNRSFPQIPFWQILDSKNWDSRNSEGEDFKDQFRDKIVLIGSTVPLHQDFHPAPFGHTGIYGQKLFGVEIQANAIATLQQGRAIADPFLNMWLPRGALVFGLIIGSSFALRRLKPSLSRLGLAVGASALWGMGSFVALIFGHTIIPIALPIASLITVGITQFLLGVVREQRHKKRLRQTLKEKATVPVVREILSQQEDDDLKGLLLEREAEVIGKILSNRYQITKVLGTGGFSETYVAHDNQRPGNPTCVVKQLRLFQGKPSKIELVRRLFTLEAETLERLGQHSQIPLLLAYFEEDYEFYLVQELIEGQSLHEELRRKARLPLYAIIQLLHDMLSVLEFVHANNIIHRDIKPHNIIRRMDDGLFVLIDFGVAKKLSDQLHDDPQKQQLTIAIGTQGYIAPEQTAGRPRFTSDLYSLGATAIEALTGLIPSQFKYDDAGEISWTHRADFISEALQDFICCMVAMDYSERYDSATSALEALQQVPEIALLREERPQIPSSPTERTINRFDDETEDASADTQIWLRNDNE